MGDIARHRDIFLNTQKALPAAVLSRAGLSASDLTYLELGNYLTDVSQFRDPVFYMYAKQTVWRDEVLPGVQDNAIATALKATLAILASAAAAGIVYGAEGRNKALGALPGAVGPLLSAFKDNINDFLADIMGVDNWLDRMLGKPVDQLDANGKRKPEDYGFVGQFFQHFIDGITQYLFAEDVTNGPSGAWGEVRRLPSSQLTKVYARSFTQYFPHEHTDQPPFVWDASKRPGHRMYQPAPRRIGRQRGIMSIVHDDYIGYLAEGLSTLENSWRQIKEDDQDGRRLWLVEMGKLLHGVEDWYFHSNVVDLMRLHAHRPGDVAERDREAFLKKTILEELRNDPAYTAPGANRKRLERLYNRRLRLPIYSRGTKENSGGVPSKSDSVLNWDHAYPAFPSTLDTAHTLLGALESLEAKLTPHHGADLSASRVARLLGAAPWIECLLSKFHNAGPEWSRIYRERAKARDLELDANGLPTTRDPTDLPRAEAFMVDVLREAVPLVLTLLYERERQRIVADLDPMAMPLDDSPPRPAPGAAPGKGQLAKQIERHVKALKPTKDKDGVEENNYARAARYIKECGSLNQAGQAAIQRAFEIDIASEKQRVSAETPGAGGFLIKFAIKLQTLMDIADRASERADRQDPFSNQATDNGSHNEIIGSHSLMSKDTKSSSPFFDDARVMSSVASQCILRLMLEEVGAPGRDRLDWQKILRNLIRFPTTTGGWERHAMDLFVQNGRDTFPTFDDLPELAELKKQRLPASVAEKQWCTGERAKKLRQRYVDLEKRLARYRYP